MQYKCKYCGYIYNYPVERESCSACSTYTTSKRVIGFTDNVDTVVTYTPRIVKKLRSTAKPNGLVKWINAA